MSTNSQLAPDFSLPDQNGVVRSLKDYSGKWVVLYFYPHNRSLNCTRQACRFRDEYRALKQFGNAEIIGINKGSVESHKAFTERHMLNFPVLSDVGHAVTSAFGAWRSKGTAFYDKPFGTRRQTFIIDPSGKIVKSYRRVTNVSLHVEQVIADLHELQSKQLNHA